MRDHDAQSPYGIKMPCGCVTGRSRCPEADRLWNSANAVYYSSGYDAWMEALGPYRHHYQLMELVQKGAEELAEEIIEDVRNHAA